MSDTATPPTMPIRNQDPETIMALECPACGFALNMRRKHIGMKGKCISCSEPIQAVEEQPGKVVVVWKKAAPAPAPAPASAVSFHLE